MSKTKNKLTHCSVLSFCTISAPQSLLELLGVVANKRWPGWLDLNTLKNFITTKVMITVNNRPILSLGLSDDAGDAGSGEKPHLCFDLKLCM